VSLYFHLIKYVIAQTNERTKAQTNLITLTITLGVGGRPLGTKSKAVGLIVPAISFQGWKSWN